MTGRGPLDAVVRVPGSKSETNRALVCAALADGDSTLEGVLLADDTDAMIEGLGALGVDIEVDRNARRAVVHGSGGVLAPGPLTVQCRLSGTVSRFLTAVAAIGPGPYTIDAAPSMRARPMAQLVEALRRLGAEVDGDCLPYTVSGAAHGGRVTLAGDVSSQYLSALLMAAPCYARGLDVELTTTLVSKPYVTLTLATMARFGVAVAEPYRVPRAAYRGADVTIEPDASAASYFWAAAAVCGGRVRVAGLTADSRQGDVGFVDVLEAMGAGVERDADGIAVRVDAPLHGVEVDMGDLSDTVPTLAVVAPFAEGPTRITGVGFIRRKESDRVGALVHELQRCGVDAREESDGLVIEPSIPHGARVETYDDHRIAMSFAVLGLRVPGVELADAGCVSKTFPEFFDVLATLRPRPGAE